MPEADSSRPDYKDTLFLPRTEFPIRGRLPENEPKWLAHWDRTDLYGQLRKASEGKKRFVLHDGPPYANGHIHAGTALNKILKDMVTRYRQMTGFDADYVPGWDCHGLPIEWQVEEEFRKLGMIDVDTTDFRRACREHARKWIDIQRDEFKRLGVTGDWARPYLTMDPESEAAIVSEFLKLARRGQIRRGARPVMWSPVEQTALAEAEIEYAERTVPAIWVRFQVAEPVSGVEVSVLIWTTTPWTIPANQAVIHNPKLKYGLYRVRATDSETDEHLIVADVRIPALIEDTGIVQIARVGDIDPAQLGHLLHPLEGMDGDLFGRTVPLLPGDYVTGEAGTGLVHCAPAHGEDDYRVWTEYPHGERDSSIVDMVDDSGRYRKGAVPDSLGGLDIISLSGKKRGRDGEANRAVIAALREHGSLLAVRRIIVRDAHSWRSKAPVIRRLTPQWFIPMDKPVHEGGPSLRQTALDQITKVCFTPERGRERLEAMVRERPDWLISRQRLWGTPMTLFVNRQSGELLSDSGVDARIVAAIARGGADLWFSSEARTFLGPDYDPDDYEQVTDILDVWFDSGCTHAFVMEPRGDWPTDLYLEGSDQHRGWFQSSLLQSCATRGQAPYRSVLTHGFVVDAKGHKMSKSLGNTVSPTRIAEQRGADILRLWTASCDYTDDPSIGEDALAAASDAYRKLRNTIRYLLGALSAESPSLPTGPPDALPGLERYILHRLAEVDGAVRRAYDAHNFRRALTEIMRLAVQDLSAFYFDIRKDSLYCDSPGAPRRKGYLYVLSRTFDHICAWLAPMLVFTCEEAWRCRHPDRNDSVHLRQFPEAPCSWMDSALAARWGKILTVKKVVNAALEAARRDKIIGSSLEAAVRVHIDDPSMLEAFVGEDPASIFITSGADLISKDAPASAFRVGDDSGIAVLFARAPGIKCARSWKYFDPLTADPDFPDITPRDAEAVRDWMARCA